MDRARDSKRCSLRMAVGRWRRSILCIGRIAMSLEEDCSRTLVEVVGSGANGCRGR